jgi:hypothetical protein
MTKVKIIIKSHRALWTLLSVGINNLTAQWQVERPTFNWDGK